jgi:hypothetical protein
MSFSCFFDHKKNFKLIFNNCHLLMTLMIGLHHFFLEMSKKCWPRSQRYAKISCPELGIAKILVCLVISLIRNRLKTAL